MPLPAHRRHDLSDAHWKLLQPHLPGQKGQWGGIAEDNRLFLSAVFWILRTGSPWRDLSPDYGEWANTHRRFIRWRDKGLWEKLMEKLIVDPDYEWLMIDASHSRSIPTPPGLVVVIKRWSAQKGAQHQDTFGRGCAWYARPSSYYGRYHGGLHSGRALAAELKAEYLIADRGYDTNAILALAALQAMTAIIPPRSHG